MKRLFLENQENEGFALRAPHCNCITVVRRICIYRHAFIHYNDTDAVRGICIYYLACIYADRVLLLLCVAILLLMQLAAAVRHCVPDGKKCCCRSLNLNPVCSWFSFKHDLFSMHPLAVLAHLRPRLAYYDTSSVIVGMRGAKRRSLPCIKYKYTTTYGLWNQLSKGTWLAKYYYAVQS